MNMRKMIMKNDGDDDDDGDDEYNDVQYMESMLSLM